MTSSPTTDLPTGMPAGNRSARAAMLALFVVSFIFFLENFDRYLLTVSLIPYLDYSSYEYSFLSGRVMYLTLQIFDPEFIFIFCYWSL